ncbi:MAG: hypothetical protein WAK24_17230 [Candidatus Acidiferrales bacterium]
MAKAAVLQLKPELAMEYLHGIKSDIEALRGNPVWIEYEITVADALAARRDEAAGYHYEQALVALDRLPERKPKLEMIAHEHFGNHLRLGHIVSRARREFETAAQIATAEHWREDNAGIRMKLILIDLEADGDPRLTDLQVLKKVAARKGSTKQDQWAAWIQHIGNDERARSGMRYARRPGAPPEAYFDRLLDSVKALPDED